MRSPTARWKQRGIFVCIEINLILWLAILGGSLAQEHGLETTLGRPVTVDSALLVFGVVLSAILQHVAYYYWWKGTKPGREKGIQNG